MEINFTGKRAIVTGAAQGRYLIVFSLIVKQNNIVFLKILGIGRGIALKLLQCGATVFALDKNEVTLSSIFFGVL